MPAALIEAAAAQKDAACETRVALAVLPGGGRYRTGERLMDLIIDDQSGDVLPLREHLERQGYEVASTVATGEALARVAAPSP